MSNKHPKHPNPRMNPGGDLYRRPLTASEMAAPLSWAEQQLAVVRRYGELADGSIGWIRIAGRLAPGSVQRAEPPYPVCSCGRVARGECDRHPNGIGSEAGDGMQE